MPKSKSRFYLLPTNVTFEPFEAADYLCNDTVIAEYLTAAAEDPNPDVSKAAISDAAKIRLTR